MNEPIGGLDRGFTVFKIKLLKIEDITPQDTGRDENE